MNIGRGLSAVTIFVCAGAAIAGCGGSGSSPAPRAVGATAVPQTKMADVAFSLHIPAVTVGQSRGRRRAYVSAGTNSAAIGIAAAGANPGTPTILNCTSGQTCSATIDAPVGSDTVTVTTYSQQNGMGAALGTATTTQSVVFDQANTIDLTLNGIVHAVELAITPATTLPAGTIATETVTVNAVDAAGYTIVSPGGYVNDSGNPVTITVAKTDYGNGNGKTTLASVNPAPSGSPEPVATGSGTTLSYTYNGSDIDETAFTTSTSSAIDGMQGRATVTYVPTFIKKFTDSTNADTNFITTGADGNLWFTDYELGEVGSVVPGTGAITHYTIPTTAVNGSAEPESIVAGPNSTMYFTEFNSGDIGMISTTTAAITGAATPVVEIPLTPSSSSATAPINPRGIAYSTVCDTNIWFTEFTADAIGVLNGTTNTATTTYAVPTAGAKPDQIACGPDGNFWFTEYGGGKIGMITAAGVITEYPLSGAASTHGPIGIVAGADGSMWFADSIGNAIGSIATSKTIPATTVGTIVEYPLPTIANPGSASLLPDVITAAPDGDLFFSEYNSETQTQNAMIGRITTTPSVTRVPGSVADTVTSYPLDDSANEPMGITLGPDGHIWYVEMGGSYVGYVIY